MDTSALLDDLKAALDRGNPAALREFTTGLHDADVAELFSELEDDERQVFVAALDHEQTAGFLSHLADPEAAEAVAILPQAEKARVFDELPDDDLVDILQAMGKEERASCLRLLPATKSKIAHTLLHYPEDSAGGRMTSSLAVLRPEMTIRQAIEELRGREEDTEVLSRIFVVDGAGKLVGKVRLRDLTFNRRSTYVRDVTDPDTTAIPATADQEEAVQIMAKYDLLALPVVDEKFRPVGVITYDDALEIQEEESTEDMERQSAIAGAPSSGDYLDTPVLQHFRRRFGWVLFLALLAILSGLVIFRYEGVLDEFFVLAIYMPMIVAAGGNTGAQAATMVIRAMSLGEFTPSSLVEVAWKEARVGLLIGTLLGVCIAVQITYLMPVKTALPPGITFIQIALTVGISLAAQITTSTLVGAVLPIAARAAKLDPAVVASPAITTVVDVTGLLIYFGVASALLGI